LSYLISSNLSNLKDNITLSYLENQDGTLDKPRWTVEKLECTVDNIGHMVGKRDGHEWTTLGGQWNPKAFRP